LLLLKKMLKPLFLS